ncbi:hypothetical protein AB0B45_49815 [Nonomuraea sp. NPDC049152]|uniref:hypothetical protein n=1 Tax=Nonomuraea sp. NPDC049152 TaxID=3154350 RepID=UPI0033E6E384
MGALPRKIKPVIALLLSPVPIGALLALVVLLTSAQTSLTLPEYEDASKISAAMWRSAARQLSAAVRDQLLSLGLFTALGAAAFSVIAWQVRRGTRKPTLMFAEPPG